MCCSWSSAQVWGGKKNKEINAREEGKKKSSSITLLPSAALSRRTAAEIFFSSASCLFLYEFPVPPAFSRDRLTLLCSHIRSSRDRYLGRARTRTETTATRSTSTIPSHTIPFIPPHHILPDHTASHIARPRPLRLVALSIWPDRPQTPIIAASPLSRPTASPSLLSSPPPHSLFFLSSLVLFFFYFFPFPDLVQDARSKARTILRSACIPRLQHPASGPRREEDGGGKWF